MMRKRKKDKNTDHFAIFAIRQDGVIRGKMTIATVTRNSSARRPLKSELSTIEGTESWENLSREVIVRSVQYCVGSKIADDA